MEALSLPNLDGLKLTPLHIHLHEKDILLDMLIDAHSQHLLPSLLQLYGGARVVATKTPPPQLEEHFPPNPSPTPHKHTLTHRNVWQSR